MQYKNNSTRFGALSIGLHWLMALLMVAVYASIELRELFERGTELRNAFKHWHFMLGLSVFFLMWLRLALKVTQTTPAIAPELPRYQMLLSKVVHGLLYLLMILMPIGGWLILSGEGKVIPFFGLELPALIAPDKAFAHDIEDIHQTFGQIGYGLIALHAFAALVHHYFFKDNTLARMLPHRD
ncbi:cytochrome b [Pseudoalteromonas tunicata]|uniref:cytochrome b n=1 Tax=Pseudoalteromonas tunicata TaxID=314281 RepID=UPI00273DC058|nr:cytochrome b [Pseudoalteromonas tunicata]MDP5213869.1 cytochrome b [Pseudoalteromonas tunicata]